MNTGTPRYFLFIDNGLVAEYDSNEALQSNVKPGGEMKAPIRWWQSVDDFCQSLQQ